MNIGDHKLLAEQVAEQARQFLEANGYNWQIGGDGFPAGTPEEVRAGGRLIAAALDGFSKAVSRQTQLKEVAEQTLLEAEEISHKRWMELDLLLRMAKNARQ